MKSQLLREVLDIKAIARNIRSAVRPYKMWANGRHGNVGAGPVDLPQPSITGIH